VSTRLHRHSAGSINPDGTLRRFATKKYEICGLNRAGVLTKLDMSGFRRTLLVMATIKISSKVEESAWEGLRALARESHQNISGVLTEAINDYVRRHHVRPEVMQHLENSMGEHEALGRNLAK